MLGEKPKQVLFEFDQDGSLATTYEGQGSAMGLAAGLMLWDSVHPEMHNSLQIAEKNDIHLDFKISDFKTDHPNTYKITAKGESGREMRFVALSTGGGMIEFTMLDGFDISLKGDFYESIFVFEKLTVEKTEMLKKELQNRFPESLIHISVNNEKVLLNIKSVVPVFENVNKKITTDFNIISSSALNPVLPIMSQVKYSLPFTNYQEMLAFPTHRKINLSELALEYESARAGISKKEVFDKMSELVRITQNGIKQGLKGTKYDDRILGQQSHLIKLAEKDKVITPSVMNNIIAFTTALMEIKSAMGVIIAAPTAGACGVLGGALFGYTGLMDVDLNKLTNAYLAAGLIGVFIAEEYTFAAEEGGCQVECGAGSGMSAGGLVEMMGGNYLEATKAASMAMQNMIGLICDPVADRVEVPCLGKNILGATNALNSATMSMAGFDEVIPLNEVIDAMKRVGNEMPSSVCCTGLSGLSTTPCSKSIYNKLKKY